ncbi:two component transcriptional regulator, LuxR family [Xylanimonas cellulosilytica DSM 15894]|uniref:Two component transcriptional regulator, LuxR family n=1 Tax=Xylanimonas cellulosilytica (strain DSM 15894 / JCM 12276 / CECT 5975 / KCTC 9989 / LMG 20990 / NBRC 107835 / XIL07) TaxID=446471 RepID=D1BUN7_XYLCX|nr:response regulator transcription factor [Xylanimonas cellulosilytica]ACZ29278.1 two component transcriptional regulator, LuxR family [Xylanimonas cellulosilytica DSM 15894]
MITVVLADDHELVRSGLRLILEAQDDIQVLSEAADGEAALREVRRLRPDVALLDIQMPRMSGLEVARAVVADTTAHTRVVMLTTFDRDDYLYDALVAGASGFMLKSSPRAHLLHAVRTAASGEALLDPSLTRRLVESHVRRPRAVEPGQTPAQLAGLSPRERDVLQALARGESNAEIAGTLFLAETTVKTHVAAVLRKLGLRDRTQAVILGYEIGLVVPGDNAPGGPRRV